LMVLHPFNRIFGLGDKSVSETEKETYHPDEVIKILVNKIETNRFQSRSIIEEEKIAELAQTLQKHEMIETNVVRKVEGDSYELIAGERRWRAVQTLE